MQRIHLLCKNKIDFDECTFSFCVEFTVNILILSNIKCGLRATGIAPAVATILPHFQLRKTRHAHTNWSWSASRISTDRTIPPPYHQWQAKHATIQQLIYLTVSVCMDGSCMVHVHRPPYTHYMRCASKWNVQTYVHAYIVWLCACVSNVSFGCHAE